MKRENLESKEFGLIIASRNFPFYAAPEADSVMDELEERIKELEAENKHLEDYIDAYQKSEALNIEKLDKKDKRIKELEAENERLKAEREEANSWDDSWKMAEQITQLEKCLVNARKENAKLKCLALHGMIGYSCWRILAFATNDNTELAIKKMTHWIRFGRLWSGFYLMAKKELKEKTK